MLLSEQILLIVLALSSEVLLLNWIASEGQSFLALKYCIMQNCTKKSLTTNEVNYAGPSPESSVFSQVRLRSGGNSKLVTGKWVEPLRNVRGLAPNQAHIEWHLTVLNQVFVASIWCGRDWERLWASAPGDFSIWAYVCVRVCVDNDSTSAARGTDEQVVWVGFSILSLPPIHTTLSASVFRQFCLSLRPSHSHFLTLLLFILFLFGNNLHATDLRKQGMIHFEILQLCSGSRNKVIHKIDCWSAYVLIASHCMTL